MDDAVPTFAMWRLSALPRYLPATDVERVIAACNRDTAVGLRDRAAILLMARLGLRAGDILNMDLGDIDWQHASVRVSGKSRAEVKLPLTQEVGDAVVEYLRRGRPSRSGYPSLYWDAGAMGSAPCQFGVGNRSKGHRASRSRDAVPRRARAASFRSHRDVTAGRHSSTGWGCTTPPVSRYNRALRQGRRTASPGHRSSVAGGVPMLSQLVDSYLELRRSTGFRMKVQGYLLRSFASFATQRGEPHICSRTAVEWAAQAPSEGQRANRLSMLRVFARFARAEDIGHEVPSERVFSARRVRYRPFIFTSDQLHDLLVRASKLLRLDRSGHGLLQRFSRCCPLPACAFPRR